VDVESNCPCCVRAAYIRLKQSDPWVQQGILTGGHVCTLRRAPDVFYAHLTSFSCGVGVVSRCGQKSAKLADFDVRHFARPLVV